jgi:opacity protein-like surface antigen
MTLKSKFLSLAFLLSLNAFSQTKNNVEFGLGLGYNSSNVSDGYTASSPSSGYNFSGSAEYYFSDTWGLKAKLSFDQKGWDDDYIYDLDTERYFHTDYNLNYITVPVTANWHFGKKRNWYLNFGPYVGFLASAKDTYFDADVKDYFNTTDFGFSYGIGVKIPVTNFMKIYIEYEGQEGFVDIMKDNYGDSFTNSRGSLNVGVNFLMN